MPTYAYQCPACGHEFEKFHKITAKIRPKCPKCGRAAERRITGGAGLLFRGSGFYITDYKKSGSSEKGEKREKGQEGQEGQRGQEEQRGQKGQERQKGQEGQKGQTAKPSDGSASKKSGEDH